LNQVFLNLLINAVDAIESTGSIWVQSAYADSWVRITIRDTGKGMDANTLAHLGEPFFTTKPVGSGMGLGLAISYRIIADHQGHLRFESQVGIGTSATVELPGNLKG
jgi:signal transduction histidine kinase